MATSSTDQASVRPHSSRWLALIVLLVGVGLGAVVTGAVITHHDNSSDATSAAPLSQVQASCREWMASSPDNGPDDDQWCTDMFAWMGNQSGGSMMGPMMWHDPGHMGDACREWVTHDGEHDAAPGRELCKRMIDWMNGHMSRRGGNWMMQGG